MINYVYVWLFVFSDVLIKYMFSQIFFSILISVWSFQCTIWLNVYQSPEASILWILWSLVKPVILFLIWQPPAFPYRHQYSIIGRFRLNHRVRDVDGCFPKAYRHQKYDVIYSGLSIVLVTRSITLPLHLARVIRPIRLRFHSILLINQRLSCLLIRQSSLITKQWTISTRFP